MKKIYMKLALELARKGVYFTSPNPMVGAVCVKNGKIISTGYHKKFGEYHAERVCLMKDIDFNGAELYVNLEPCSHKGKTPPCTDIIIKKGIKKVYIANRDPNPMVNGVDVLRKNGIEVETGILKEEALLLNQAFFCNIRKKRPYITLKIATSLDGKISSEKGISKNISSETALKFVHILRAESDAILVGINTVLKDNPKLTVRLKGVEKKIKRVVLDSKLKIPIKSYLVESAPKTPLIIFTLNESNKDKIRELREKGIEVILSEQNSDEISLDFVINELCKRKIGKLMVEGGTKIASSFLKNRLVDRVIQEIAVNKILGGSMSYTKNVFYDSPEKGKIIKDWKIYDIDDNIIVEGLINVYRDN